MCHKSEYQVWFEKEQLKIGEELCWHTDTDKFIDSIAYLGRKRRTPGGVVNLWGSIFRGSNFGEAILVYCIGRGAGINYPS